MKEIAETTAQELLISVLQLDADRLPTAEVAPETWQAVSDLARRHGLSPLLYAQLRNRGALSQVPSSVLQSLRLEYLASANTNAELYRHLTPVLDSCHRAGIPVIILKGAFLAQAVYDNIAARPMGDVDLLVQKSDLARMERVLLALDFEHANALRETIKETHHFAFVHKFWKLMVEVHWDLIDATFGGIHVDVDGLWRRAQSAEIGGIPVLALSPEDCLLHLCMHIAVDAYEGGLRPVCDVAGVIRHCGPGINWSVLTDRACEWGAAKCVYVALKLARQLLCAAIPDDVIDALQPGGLSGEYITLAREQVLKAESHVTGLFDARNVIRFWTKQSALERIKSFGQSLFLPRQVMSVVYPVPADSPRIWLYYPNRVKDLISRHGHVVWELWRGDREMISRAQRRSQVNALQDWLLSG